MNRRIVLMMTIIVILYACIGCKGNTLSKTSKTLTAKDKLQTKDFQIDGLYLQQPIIEATKVLGKPIKVKTILNKDGVHEYDEEEHYFSGIVIGIYKIERKVISLAIENKSLKTHRGVRVGDKEEAVYYHYGNAKRINDAVSYWMLTSQKPINVYYVIGFHIRNGKVTRIDINYVPEE